MLTSTQTEAVHDVCVRMVKRDIKAECLQQAILTECQLLCLHQVYLLRQHPISVTGFEIAMNIMGLCWRRGKVSASFSLLVLFTDRLYLSMAK
jgi:hypothetical protein